jgi:hypothetical protein
MEKSNWINGKEKEVGYQAFLSPKAAQKRAF